MNYISVIERYHENREFIHELMASIVAGIFDEKLFDEEEGVAVSMEWLSQNYPFVELIYTLDEKGVQKSRNISKKSLFDEKDVFGKGVDRNQRPYFKQAIESDKVIVTAPYLSTTSHHLCISAAVRAIDKEGNLIGVLVVDINLAHVIEFLMGDRKRQKAHPYFVGIYSVIVLGLFFVVGILIFSAGKEIVTMFQHPIDDSVDLKPFGVIIFLTLALAIFDLGKTIL